MIRRMPPSGEEKPYRVYRGGRLKGGVPTLAREQRTKALERDGRRRVRRGGPEDPFGPRPPRPRPRWYRRWSWKRWLVIGVASLFTLVLIWGIASWFSFRSGVIAANRRLPKSVKAVLVKQDGLLLSHPSNILLLGTDSAKSRPGNRHSDSIMIVHTDPGKHRIVYLSIMRDLRVEIPGYGTQKINAAYQFGGPRLAVRTIRSVTGIPINHIALVDFAQFQKLIDDLGGVTIDVPEKIHSNKFDCPFKTQAQCDKWTGWRFAKGPQHMDGHRALIYSRIRENLLNPSESDATRGARQQQVIQAIGNKLTSFWELAQMPFVGGDIMRPLATDLSAGQLVQLGWVKFRGKTLRCRLGGTADGSGYIIADEQSRAVISMVLGKSAPQPPPPGSLFGSGCVSGKASL